MPVGSRDEVNVEPGSFRASVVLWYACHDTLIFFFFFLTHTLLSSLWNLWCKLQVARKAGAEGKAADKVCDLGEGCLPSFTGCLRLG